MDRLGRTAHVEICAAGFDVDRPAFLGRDDVRAIGPYVAPVKLSPGGEVRPGNLRELIRLGGPTIELPETFGIESPVGIFGHVRL